MISLRAGQCCFIHHMLCCDDTFGPCCSGLLGLPAGCSRWLSSHVPSPTCVCLCARVCTQVETIGDCYMITAGLLQPDPDHAGTLVRFAASMIRAASHVALPASSQCGPSELYVQLRVGIASGPCYSGIIGSIRKRYCLVVSRPGGAQNSAALCCARAFCGCHALPCLADALRYCIVLLHCAEVALNLQVHQMCTAVRTTRRCSCFTCLYTQSSAWNTHGKHHTKHTDVPSSLTHETTMMCGMHAGPHSEHGLPHGEQRAARADSHQPRNSCLTGRAPP